jgi:hypothetical protein
VLIDDGGVSINFDVCSCGDVGDCGSSDDVSVVLLVLLLSSVVSSVFDVSCDWDLK